MPHKTTRQILDKARMFHKELSSRYHRISDDAVKQRLGMLMDYISMHEKHMGEIVDRFEDEATEGVLDTWFQSPPDEILVKRIDELNPSSEDSIGELLKKALELDDELIEFYRWMVEHAVAEDVKSLLQALLDLEESEARSLARNAGALMDL